MNLIERKNGVIKVKEFERGVRFRFGKKAGIIEPGLHLAVPGISEIRLMDLRPRSYETSFEVFGSDKYPVVLPMGMIYRANDAEKVIIKSPENIENQIGILLNSRLGMQIYNNKSFEEIFLSREKIEDDARNFLGEFLSDWGFEIDAIKIKQPTAPQVTQFGKQLYETEMRQMIEPMKALIEKKVKVIGAEANAEVYRTQVAPQLEAFNAYMGIIAKAAGEIAETFKTDARDVMYILFSSNLGADHPVTKKIFTKMGMEGMAEGAKAVADKIGTGTAMPYLLEALKGIGGLYLTNFGNIGRLTELDRELTARNFPSGGKY
ncbi:MAG: SPFH domain-containing protein [Candidatus Aenigmarchaeota archaeon]|nr:SPFH domain-containing protein [Candidatus Aenigmarchaeota archaeon]